MARSRNIKPAFFFNEQLAEVEPLGRILFIGLWTIADREGRLEDRPRKIKAEVLAYDDCDVDKLLTELHEKGFIVRYEVEGKKYIWIKKFSKHQNPHVKEAQSTIPKYCPEAPCHLDPLSPDLSPDSSEKCPVISDTSLADSFKRIPDSPSLMPDSLNPESEAPEKTAAAAVEKEFGRPLSPLEWDQVKYWEEKYGLRLVKEALKIAVLKGVCRLKFIDAILLEWEKANLHTFQQVLDCEARRKRCARVSSGYLGSSRKDLEGLYEL